MQGTHRKSIKCLLLACMLFLLSLFQIFVGSTPQKVEEGRLVRAEEASNQESDGEGEDGGPELEIHFYPLGYNDKDGEHQVLGSGDSFIITVGDTQILVDAGVTQESGRAIVRQMQKACGYNEENGTYQDKKWDYIIVTHSDSDHISAFTSGDSKVKPIFSTLFLGNNAPLELGKLIDFDISQDKDLAEKSYNRYQDLYLYKGKTKQVYERYAKARDELKKKYGDDVYSPISQICKDHREYVEENQGSLNEKELWEHRARPIPLADGVTLNFLYNYHNDHREEKTKITSADINNLSVCFTIDYEQNGKTERFLFTGDLEEFDSQKKVEGATRGMQRINGESDLVKYNPWLKEGVMLYKAAHHGSKTSSSDNLMEAINPKHIVIPATAGNKEKSDGEKEAAQESEGSTESSSTTQNTGNKTGKKFGFPNQEAIDSMYRYTDNIYITALDGEGTETGPADYYGDLKFTYTGEDLNVQAGNPQMYENGKLLPLHKTPWFQKNRETPCHVVTLAGEDEETGVNFIGNSSLVKLGNTEIVVDCGLIDRNDSRRANSRQFLNQIDEYCTDDVIEYLLISSNQMSDWQQLLDRGEDGEIKGLFSRFTVKNIIHFENYKLASANENSGYGDVCSKLKELEDLGVNVITATDMDVITVEDGLEISSLMKGGKFYGYCVEYQKKDFLFPRSIAEEDSEFLYDSKYRVAYIRVPGFGYALGLSESLLKRLKKKDEALYIAINGIAGATGSMGADSGKKTCTKDYCDMLNRNGREVFLTQGYTEGEVQNMGDIVFTMWYQNDSKAARFDMYSWIGGNIKNSQLCESKYYQRAS